MGTLTINTTSPQDARIVAAFGDLLGKAGNATAGEVKSRVIQFAVDTVRDYEQRLAAAAAVAAIDSIVPT